jgi:hypothetical protein
MFDDQKADEWTPLKKQLEALVHEADMLEDALEQFREDQIRRRFGELIAGAAERNRLRCTPIAR